MDARRFETLVTVAQALATRGPAGLPATGAGAGAAGAERVPPVPWRRVLGIAGAPGAGKSTLAERLVARLDGLVVLVPMDGFHLAGAELERLGRAGRKGAPDTFDAAGYVALLARLRTPEPGVTVYAPAFDRSLEEPVAGSIPVGPGVPLVVTEGNYLLHDEGAWAGVRPLLDEAWYLDLDARTRVSRLVERHVRFGKDRARAERWVRDSDEPNARLIARGRDRADRVITAE